MHRKFFLPLLMASAMAAAAAAAFVDPVAGISLGCTFLAVLSLSAVSASNGNPMPARRLPHWLDVAVYRFASFGVRARNRLGQSLMAWQMRTGTILCAFPGAVKADLAFGIVGELAFDGPFRAQAARINVAATAANCVVGRWFTMAADGTVSPGGAGSIGGILMNPKNYASVGAGGVPLAPSLLLIPGTIGEFGYMGAFVVSVSTAVAIGQAAWYDTTTGAIGAGAPGGGQAAIPNSKFTRYANAAAGLAVLELTN